MVSHHDSISALVWRPERFLVLRCSKRVLEPPWQKSFVRWVRLTCPNGPAVRMSPSGSCGVRENPCTHIFPIFTPPTGLLGLYAVDHANPTCPDNSPYAGYLMVNGVGEIYGSFGFPATDLDYCAVTTASGGTMDEFSVRWSLGYGVLSPWFRSSFPSNVTVTQGGTATFTMTLTSYNPYSGNLSFATGQVSNEYAGSPITPPTLSFSPRSVILKADGSNSTLVTIHAAPNTNLGSWRAQLFMTPVYGLWYYGGFTPAPYASANGTTAITAINTITTRGFRPFNSVRRRHAITAVSRIAGATRNER